MLVSKEHWPTHICVEVGIRYLSRVYKQAYQPISDRFAFGSIRSKSANRISLELSLISVFHISFYLCHLQPASIGRGIYSMFSSQNKQPVTILINYCDLDVCSSWGLWLREADFSRAIGYSGPFPVSMTPCCRLWSMTGSCWLQIFIHLIAELHTGSAPLVGSLGRLRDKLNRPILEGREGGLLRLYWGIIVVQCRLRTPPSAAAETWDACHRESLIFTRKLCHKNITPLHNRLHHRFKDL